MARLAPPVFGAEVCGVWGGVRTRESGESVTHWAFDLCMDEPGAYFYNLLDGIVQDVVWSEHGGNQVVMHWPGVGYARHSHCNRIFVRKGQFCERYKILGEVGKTGVNYRGIPVSTHLHLQIMDGYPHGDPVNMPDFLYRYGIEERNHQFVWRDGYPKGGLFLPVLGGLVAAGGLLAVSEAGGAKWIKSLTRR